MPRSGRVAPADLVYHVLNRGVGRMTLFEDAADYAAFERCLRRAQNTVPVRLVSHCLMANTLAHGALAARWRRPGRVHATVNDHPRAAMAGESPLSRDGARLPRTLQIVSDRTR